MSLWNSHTFLSQALEEPAATQQHAPMSALVKPGTAGQAMSSSSSSTDYLHTAQAAYATDPSVQHPASTIQMMMPTYQAHQHFQQPHATSANNAAQSFAYMPPPPPSQQPQQQQQNQQPHFAVPEPPSHPTPQPQPQQQQQAQQQQNSEACYYSLLGMAESFRQSGNARMTLHCLQAVLQFRLPEHIIARTNLQIGRLLLQQLPPRPGASTQNGAVAVALVYLEAAWNLRALCAQSDLAACLEAADLLVDCLLGGEVGSQPSSSANPRIAALLDEALAASHGVPEWHCRFLLKLAQHLSQSEPGRACELLALGSQYAQQHRSEYTRGLFLLGKCLLLLASRQLAEVHNTLTVTSKVIEAVRPGGNRQETLRIFSLIIQVMNHLLAGQAKQARPMLRQLQKAIQAFSAAAAAAVAATDETEAGQAEEAEDKLSAGLLDQFEWLSREHMSVLVYLLTLLHNMQEAQYEKVQRYTEKALTQVEKLKAVEDRSPLLSVLHLCILEQSFQCHLVSGQRDVALRQLAASVRLCSECPNLSVRRSVHCRAMLGLYAMTTNCLGAAESQFRQALQLSPRPDLHQFVCLNLALVMLRQNRLSDCQQVLSECQQHQLQLRRRQPSTSAAASAASAAAGSESAIAAGGCCLRAAGHWVDGLLAMMLGDFNRAKLCIKESLKLANAENLRRLLTLSLIVLGQAHFASGQYDEVKKVVDAGVQLAEQIPDEAVQLWASVLMRDLHRAEGSPQLEAACAQRHSSLLAGCQASMDRATEAPEHQLIYWLDGPPPEVPTVSSAPQLPQPPQPPHPSPQQPQFYPSQLSLLPPAASASGYQFQHQHLHQQPQPPASSHSVSHYGGLPPI